MRADRIHERGSYTSYVIYAPPYAPHGAPVAYGARILIEFRHGRHRERLLVPYPPRLTLPNARILTFSSIPEALSYADLIRGHLPRGTPLEVRGWQTGMGYYRLSGRLDMRPEDYL